MPLLSSLIKIKIEKLNDKVETGEMKITNRDINKIKGGKEIKIIHREINNNDLEERSRNTSELGSNSKKINSIDKDKNNVNQEMKIIWEKLNEKTQDKILENKLELKDKIKNNVQKGQTNEKFPNEIKGEINNNNPKMQTENNNKVKMEKTNSEKTDIIIIVCDEKKINEINELKEKNEEEIQKVIAEICKNIRINNLKINPEDNAKKQKESNKVLQENKSENGSIKKKRRHRRKKKVNISRSKSQKRKRRKKTRHKNKIQAGKIIERVKQGNKNFQRVNSVLDERRTSINKKSTNKKRNSKIINMILTEEVDPKLKRTSNMLNLKEFEEEDDNNYELIVSDSSKEDGLILNIDNYERVEENISNNSTGIDVNESEDSYKLKIIKLNKSDDDSDTIFDREKFEKYNKEINSSNSNKLSDEEKSFEIKFQEIKRFQIEKDTNEELKMLNNEEINFWNKKRRNSPEEIKRINQNDPEEADDIAERHIQADDIAERHIQADDLKENKSVNKNKRGRKYNSPIKMKNDDPEEAEDIADLQLQENEFLKSKIQIKNNLHQEDDIADLQSKKDKLKGQIKNKNKKFKYLHREEEDDIAELQQQEDDLKNKKLFKIRNGEEKIKISPHKEADDDEKLQLQESVNLKKKKKINKNGEEYNYLRSEEEDIADHPQQVDDILKQKEIKNIKRREDKITAQTAVKIMSDKLSELSNGINKIKNAITDQTDNNPIGMIKDKINRNQSREESMDTSEDDNIINEIKIRFESNDETENELEAEKNRELNKTFVIRENENALTNRINVRYARQVKIIDTRNNNNNDKNNTAKSYARVNETIKYWKGDIESEISRIHIESERNSEEEEGRSRDAGNFTQRTANPTDDDTVNPNANATTMAERRSTKKKLLKEEEKDIRERIQRKNEKRKRRGRRIKRVQLLREYEARISTDSSGDEESLSGEDDSEHAKTIKVLGEYEKRRGQDFYKTDTYTVENDKGDKIAVIDNIISIRNLTPISNKSIRNYSIRIDIRGDEIQSREIIVREQQEDGSEQRCNAVQTMQRKIEIQDQDPRMIYEKMKQLPSTSGTQETVKTDGRRAIEAAKSQEKSINTEKHKRRGRPRKTSVSQHNNPSIIVEEKKKSTAGKNLSKKECKQKGVMKKYAHTLSSSSDSSDTTYTPDKRTKSSRKTTVIRHDSTLNTSVLLHLHSNQDSNINVERRLKPADVFGTSAAFEACNVSSSKDDNEGTTHSIIQSPKPLTNPNLKNPQIQELESLYRKMDRQKQIQPLAEMAIMQSSQKESADEQRRASPVNEPMDDEAVVEQIESQMTQQEDNRMRVGNRMQTKRPVRRRAAKAATRTHRIISKRDEK